VQIFTLDIVTGSRTQLTHLPFVADRVLGGTTSFLVLGTGFPTFRHDGRIAFFSFGNIDGSNPEGNQVEFLVNPDGSGLKRVPLPVATPGSQVVPIFGSTAGGARRSSIVLSTPGTPLNPDAGDTISEVFFFDREHLVQLTSFRRSDTGSALLTRDGKRVILAASADPFGTNPSGDCQLFSISTVGADLRQLTRFSQPEASMTGCHTTTPPGCRVIPVGLEPATGTLVFYSSCDPFGTNPLGDQLFSIRADGTHLRQLTHARGLVTEADGTPSAENIGPFAIPAPATD
jgi:hypothetical protein